MPDIDHERAREILKVAALVTDRFTQNTYLAFVHEKLHARAKTLLAAWTEGPTGVGECDDQGTYWLKVKDDKLEELMALLPQKRDLSPAPENHALLDRLEKGRAGANLRAEVRQRLHQLQMDKQRAEHTIMLEVEDMGAASRIVVHAALEHAAHHYAASRGFI